jgi:hypothetical protein
VPVDHESVPPHGVEALGDVLGERDVGRAIDRDVVVVVQIHEATEAEMAGE